MKKATGTGVDLAKRVFQAHGAAAEGSVVFRKKLSRAQLLPFLAQRSACTAAMEACATSHYRGWEGYRRWCALPDGPISTRSEPAHNRSRRWRRRPGASNCTVTGAETSNSPKPVVTTYSMRLPR